MATRDLEYKPLLYTTTVRNPERVKSLLNILVQFDGQTVLKRFEFLICCRWDEGYGLRSRILDKYLEMRKL